MKKAVDLIIDTEHGERIITITPVNLTPADDVHYATGQYDLTEGEVGLGTITFNTNAEWEFDGITDLAEDIIERSAELIKNTSRHPEGIIDPTEMGVESAGWPVATSNAEVFEFDLEEAGESLHIKVTMNYPFYDVGINGNFAAQLEQDHHSNWFITTGRLDDKLVQEIGRRIVEYITQ